MSIMNVFRKLAGVFAAVLYIASFCYNIQLALSPGAPKANSTAFVLSGLFVLVYIVVIISCHNRTKALYAFLTFSVFSVITIIIGVISYFIDITLAEYPLITVIVLVSYLPFYGLSFLTGANEFGGVEPNEYSIVYLIVVMFLLALKISLLVVHKRKHRQ